MAIHALIKAVRFVCQAIKRAWRGIPFYGQLAPGKNSTDLNEAIDYMAPKLTKLLFPRASKRAIKVRAIRKIRVPCAIPIAAPHFVFLCRSQWTAASPTTRRR
jgi:hypothetical protein